MTLRLHNTLTKKVDEFVSLTPNEAKIYSCGPTVYDHAHIGNLSSLIFADLLRRIVTANNYKVRHVMNMTDVDDKTIRRSQESYPDLDPHEALKKLTSKYTQLFMNDMELIGNDIDALTFINATDARTIDAMQQMIRDLHTKGFAYIADDGVYFSIDAYKKSGKIYGQLVTISTDSTSQERIQNDEYDKDSAHDFALWKVQKDGEPAWPFELEGKEIAGRPGWHIECSVMSKIELGQPFDLHTGGIDLAFPHHENEIAQSTAGQEDPVYASMFVHNEHILVDGKKMSKSLGNFYTLSDLIEKGVDPLAFRLLVLQAHYSSQSNFSFDNVEAADNRLKHWREIAVLRHQIHDTLASDREDSDKELNAQLQSARQAIIEALSNNLDTPAALAIIDSIFGRLDTTRLDRIDRHELNQLLETIDDTLGIKLRDITPDISDDQKRRILERQNARTTKNWQISDEIRDELLSQGVALKDNTDGVAWYRI